MMGWKTVRVVGNLLILKVSYLALALLPFAANFIDLLVQFDFSKFQLFCLYFSSLTLAVANLLYDVFCPPIIKRFESANDLYRDMLSIKQASIAVYPDDKFTGDYDHAVNAYKKANNKKTTVFWITFCFFVASLIMFIILFSLRTWAFMVSLLPSLTC